MTTEDTFVIADRQTKRRGTTPFLDGAAETAYIHCPLGLDQDNYSKLIGLGATKEMIQQFKLEYTSEQGIGMSHIRLKFIIIH